MTKPKDKEANIPPASSDGIRTRFHPQDEHHLRKQVGPHTGHRNVQDVIRDLAQKDRIAKEQKK